MSLSKENKVTIDGQTYYGGLNQPPKFVKVNVDCWEKIFDYLSLRDIVSMSQTCQRMRQIGGYYFRENFHGLECHLYRDSGRYFYLKNGASVELEREDFLRFVDAVSINRYKLEGLRHYSSMDLLGSLTTLNLSEVELKANAIGNFEKNLLNNIETIELSYCTIHDGSAGQLFASCPKLKCLKMDNMTSNNLLRYTYPMLKRFEYIDCHEPASLLTSFLKRNSSIKYLRIDTLCLVQKFLRIDARCLTKIGLNTSKVQLDCLSVDVYGGSIEFADLLKTLHSKGFYKKLHLRLGFSSDQELMINEMKSFGALEVLKIHGFNGNICHLTELKELQIARTLDVVDLKPIAMNLTKLERLWICGSGDHLIPFVRNAKALKVAVLENHDANPLNLYTLNHERQMGGSWRKVLIGVNENQYLATKWKSGNLNYELVQITRVETIRERFEYLIE